MTKIPPFLKKGDTIGLIAPAGYMPEDKYAQCIKTLHDWGFKTLLGKTPGREQINYFSGTDEERKEDFQLMLDNPDVRAILCVRGGYGTGRIIDDLDFKKFKRHPKWVIGFSDITVLHCHIFTTCNVATIHGPMAAAFNDGGWENEFVGSLRNTLVGKKNNYKIPATEFNRPGEAEGILVGGNLSLLSNMTGSVSELNTKGKILFIEDVGEYIYNIDRMLYQLKRSGKFEGIRGLVVGSFNDSKDTTAPFGQTVEQVVNQIVKDYDFPVCFHFPVGHEQGNYALKVGVKYQLKVGRKVVNLKEV